jgi:alpha-glucoside transport system permease protein
MSRLTTSIPVIGALIAAVVFMIVRQGEPGSLDRIEVVQWLATGGILWGAGLLVLTRGSGMLRVFFGAVLLIFTWFILRSPQSFDRLASTLLVVLVAVSLIGGLWIASNLVMNVAPKNWGLFSALSGGTLAALFFAILRGNRSILPLVADGDPIAFGAGGGFLGHVEWPIFGFLVWGGGLFAMRMLPRVPRLALGVAMGALTGFLIGQNVQAWHRGSIGLVEVIVATAIGIAVGAGIRAARQSDPIPGALLGAAVGWTIGTWFLSPFAGSANEASLAAIVPLALLGLRLAWNDNPTDRQLARFDNRARAVIFLGPAMLFLFSALVVPAIRTIVLSLRNRDSSEFVGFDNYTELWNDTDSFDFSNWTDMFTSQLFWVAALLLISGVVIGVVSGIRRNGEAGFERTGSSVGPILFGLFLFAFAALSVLRGTFFNNIWWVITVTTVSVGLGLTIAVLAEKAGRAEAFAKSLIFMPMAVSFVGASIVWRLQYQPRPANRTQTGVLNSAWVKLGELSHSGAPRIIVLLILAAIIAKLAWSGYQKAMARAPFTINTIGIIVFGYLFIELLRRSLGGFTIGPNGEIQPDVVIFLQEPPFNNVFMMIILIWIQTGFAMVILSAAIKAVPQEFIEAAKVDGATESQTFFQVIFPQILPTVGVVTTTLIVLVTKVFDIVKVTTGGNFGTNVLANDMFEVSFSFANFGLGSAIAVFILVSVLPVMFINVRRMQQERVVNR